MGRPDGDRREPRHRNARRPRLVPQPPLWAAHRSVQFQAAVMTTLVSFERVLEVTDLTPSITDSEKAVPVPDGPVGVEFEDVGFAYPAPSEISLASLEAVKKLSDEPG